MRAVRNRELDHLREIILSRAGKTKRGKQPTVSSTEHACVTRSPATDQASCLMSRPQMVRKINELEVVALSEAMHKVGRSQSHAPRGSRVGLDTPALAGLLDDAALMLAASHWSLAAELLHRVAELGTAASVKDWALRSAIDLLVRGEQDVRATQLSRLYIQQHGHTPDGVIPVPVHPGAPPGALSPIPLICWHCPRQLDLAAVTALQLKLHTGRIEGC